MCESGTSPKRWSYTLPPPSLPFFRFGTLFFWDVEQVPDFDRYPPPHWPEVFLPSFPRSLLGHITGPRRLRDQLYSTLWRSYDTYLLITTPQLIATPRSTPEINHNIGHSGTCSFTTPTQIQVNKQMPSNSTARQGQGAELTSVQKDNLS